MYIRAKKVISVVLITLFILLSPSAFADESQGISFSDIPKEHWAYKDVHELRELKITDGIGNNKFGLGLTIKRSEFVAYLVKLMQWELIRHDKGSFIDNEDNSKWYFSFVETALENGVISKNTDKFRPNEPITREDMAIMIVNTLGYDALAKQLSNSDSSFNDVSNNVGYISSAKDFGIITGVGDNAFKPNATAKREEAAAMMMRMYRKINQPINELHAFYAISSYSQMQMIENVNSVSFGWSRLEVDEKSSKIVLNTTRNNTNDFGIPSGFDQPFKVAKDNNVSTQLMVFAENKVDSSNISLKGIPFLEYILRQEDTRRQAIDSIVQKVNSTTKDGITISFEGVVIDFESMSGKQLRKDFIQFLKDLKLEMDKSNKKIFVAVHPKSYSMQEYYDGYDYKAIGEIADKVILMAHDYYAKTLSTKDMENGYTVTPLSPIKEIYYALKAITDNDTGILDKNKIWLQLSFDTVQWKLKDGKVINQYPIKPSYNALWQRLATDVSMNYSNQYKNPYVTFFDSNDKTDNVLWYEDSRSVQDKINIAKMFGINGVSLWRLGNIPDYDETPTKNIYLDIWQQILINVKQ